MAKPTGIRRLHSASCPAYTNAGQRCDCGAGYEASVWDRASGCKIRKTFPTLAAARAWRSDAEQGIRRGTLRYSTPVTVREAADELVAGMRSGAVRTRGGDAYKPSACRSYDEALRVHVLPSLGAINLGDVQRRHVQRLVDDLHAAKAAPSSIRNALMPLRVIYRRALRDGLVAVNPCDGLDLPAVRGRRDRIVAPEHAAALIAALPEVRDRAVWATAFYAGLRRGEMMALRFRDLDLAGGSIQVERSYDRGERVFVEPKSRSGRRRIPVAGALRDVLLDLRASLTADPEPEALVFGDGPEPFRYDALMARSRKAWERAQLEPSGLHEARHTCASVFIAAGVGIKALSEFMGHASITITLDRYGHLLPGSIAEAASLLDAFLARTGEQTGEHEPNPLQIDA
jgi:integrase